MKFAWIDWEVWWDEWNGIFKALGFILASVVILILSMSIVNILVWHVPVRVFVDGREVYHGITACIDVDSTGATTKVSIRRGRLCWWPAANYVSRDVHVEGDLR